MEARIEDGHLLVRIPLETPRESSTGKTLIVASTGGNVVTTARYDGKPIVLGLNAFIRKGKPAEVVAAELA
jgi:hypothetical protein